MSSAAFCWECGWTLEKTWAELIVDGNPVRVHKICARNRPKTVTAAPRDGTSLHEVEARIDERAKE